MKAPNLLLISFLISSISILPAYADGHEQRGPSKIFEKADTNQDGITSKQEFLDFHEQKFDEIDSDGDGNITKEDLTAHIDSKREEKKGEMFDKMDQDGSGQISREELEAFHSEMKEKRKTRRKHSEE
jgi:Ca2+-binding EF-hand superfamily protein